MPSSPFSTSDLYNIQNIDISEIERYPDGLRDIYERKIDGLIVHNVYGPADIDLVADRIRSGTVTASNKKKGFGTIGQVLIRADLRTYFAAVEPFRRACRKLFEGRDAFEARIESIMRSMANERPVEIPRNEEGGLYTPATIRILGEDGGLNLHCGNQFLGGMPAFKHLSTLLHLEDQLSYFMTIAAPESGGELVLYDMEWSETQDGSFNGKSVFEEVKERKQMKVSPPPGAVLFFDGGRIWHEVRPVLGSKSRITIGGFAAFSLDQNTVHYWS